MQVGKDFWRRQRIGLLVFQLTVATDVLQSKPLVFSKRTTPTFFGAVKEAINTTP